MALIFSSVQETVKRMIKFEKEKEIFEEKNVRRKTKANKKRKLSVERKELMSNLIKRDENRDRSSREADVLETEIWN